MVNNNKNELENFLTKAFVGCDTKIDISSEDDGLIVYNNLNKKMKKFIKKYGDEKFFRICDYAEKSILSLMELQFLEATFQENIFGKDREIKFLSLSYQGSDTLPIIIQNLNSIFIDSKIEFLGVIPLDKFQKIYNSKIKDVSKILKSMIDDQSIGDVDDQQIMQTIIIPAIIPTDFDLNMKIEDFDIKKKYFISNIVDIIEIRKVSERVDVYFWIKAALDLPIDDIELSSRDGFLNCITRNGKMDKVKIKIDLVKSHNSIKTLSKELNVVNENDVFSLSKFWASNATIYDSFTFTFQNNDL